MSTQLQLQSHTFWKYRGCYFVRVNSSKKLSESHGEIRQCSSVCQNNLVFFKSFRRPFFHAFVLSFFFSDASSVSFSFVYSDFFVFPVVSLILCSTLSSITLFKSIQISAKFHRWTNDRCCIIATGIFSCRYQCILYDWERRYWYDSIKVTHE